MTATVRNVHIDGDMFASFPGGTVDFDALVEDVVALWLAGDINYPECAEQLRALSDRREQQRSVH